MDAELCAGRIMERRGQRRQRQGRSHPPDGLRASIDMPLGAQRREQGTWQVPAPVSLPTMGHSKIHLGGV